MRYDVPSYGGTLGSIRTRYKCLGRLFRRTQKKINTRSKSLYSTFESEVLDGLINLLVVSLLLFDTLSMLKFATIEEVLAARK